MKYRFPTTYLHYSTQWKIYLSRPPFCLFQFLSITALKLLDTALVSSNHAFSLTKPKCNKSRSAFRTVKHQLSKINYFCKSSISDACLGSQYAYNRSTTSGENITVKLLNYTANRKLI